MSSENTGNLKKRKKKLNGDPAGQREELEGECVCVGGVCRGPGEGGGEGGCDVCRGGVVVLRVHVGRCDRVHLLGQRTPRTYPLTAVTIRSEAREHGQ